jgi:hypothetical protein
MQPDVVIGPEKIWSHWEGARPEERDSVVLKCINISDVNIE